MSQVIGGQLEMFEQWPQGQRGEERQGTNDQHDPDEQT
jgi:hypothetical protein